MQISVHPVFRRASTKTARHFNTLIGLSDQFSNSLTSTFAKNIAEGMKFDDALKSVRRSLVETGLKMALAPLQIGLSQT